MLRCLLCRASLQCPGSYSDVQVWNWWTYELPDSALVSVSWKSYPLAKYSLSGVCLATCSVSQSQSVLKSDMKFSSSSLCIYQQLVKCSLKLFCWALLVNFSTCPVLCLKSQMVALWRLSSISAFRPSSMGTGSHAPLWQLQAGKLYCSSSPSVMWTVWRCGRLTSRCWNLKHAFTSSSVKLVFSDFWLCIFYLCGSINIRVWALCPCLSASLLDYCTTLYLITGDWAVVAIFAPQSYLTIMTCTFSTLSATLALTCCAVCLPASSVTILSWL